MKQIPEKKIGKDVSIEVADFDYRKSNADLELPQKVMLVKDELSSGRKSGRMFSDSLRSI